MWGNDKTDRERGRGWGPFTGRQLTTIICIGMVTILFPVGAWAAVSGSNVFVTDATSGVHAKVSSAGALSTSGALSLTPTSAMYHTENLGANTCDRAQCTTLAKPPTGKALAITTIEIDAWHDTAGFGGPNEYILIARSTDGTCRLASLTSYVSLVEPSSAGSQTLTYNLPGALPVPKGTALCLQNASDTLQVVFGAYGVTASPSAVPAT